MRVISNVTVPFFLPTSSRLYLMIWCTCDFIKFKHFKKHFKHDAEVIGSIVALKSQGTPIRPHEFEVVTNRRHSILMWDCTMELHCVGWPRPLLFSSSGSFKSQTLKAAQTWGPRLWVGPSSLGGWLEKCFVIPGCHDGALQFRNRAEEMEPELLSRTKQRTCSRGSKI